MKRVKDSPARQPNKTTGIKKQSDIAPGSLYNLLQCNIVSSTGETIIVDYEDFDKLSKYSWHIKHGYGTDYARTNTSRKYGKQVKVTLHEFLLGKSLFGLIIDHINGNGLDNRKSNLRRVSIRENGCNRNSHRGGKTPGVIFNKHCKKYEVRLRILGDRISLGCFNLENEAIKARENYLKSHIVGHFS